MMNWEALLKSESHISKASQVGIDDIYELKISVAFLKDWYKLNLLIFAPQESITKALCGMSLSLSLSLQKIKDEC